MVRAYLRRSRAVQACPCNFRLWHRLLHVPGMLCPLPCCLHSLTDFVLQPNAENVVKMGIHSNGYLCASDNSTASVPRTAVTHGVDGLRIPKEAVKAFREGLRSVYPELGEKPFQGTRLCWYVFSIESVEWLGIAYAQVQRYPRRRLDSWVPSIGCRTTTCYRRKRPCV